MYVQQATRNPFAIREVYKYLQGKDLHYIHSYTAASKFIKDNSIKFGLEETTPFK